MRANIAAKLSPDWLPELNEEQVVELADGGRGLLVTACCQAQKAAQIVRQSLKAAVPRRWIVERSFHAVPHHRFTLA